MNTYNYQKLRGLKRKVELINLRGGKCEICGYDKNIAAFDFHHITPKDKKISLDARHLSNQSMSVILEELKKCILLCANCHRETHSPELEMALVIEIIKDADQSIIEVKEKVAVTCCDCKCEINYGSTRCIPCNNIFKTNPNKPKLELLMEEAKANGITWCSKKYNVSRRTIDRWLGKKVS